MTPKDYLKHLSYEVCSLIESGDHDLDKIQAFISHGRSQLVIDDEDLRSQTEQSIELIAICYPLLMVKYEVLGHLVGEAFAYGLDEVINSARDEIAKRKTTEAKMLTILDKLGVDKLPRLTYSLQTVLRAEPRKRLLHRLVLCEKLEAQYLIGWNRDRGNAKGVARQQNYLDVAERALTCL
jgi:hypothetical protein